MKASTVIIILAVLTLLVMVVREAQREVETVKTCVARGGHVVRQEGNSVCVDKNGKVIR